MCECFVCMPVCLCLLAAKLSLQSHGTITLYTILSECDILEPQVHCAAVHAFFCSVRLIQLTNGF